MSLLSIVPAKIALELPLISNTVVPALCTLNKLLLLSDIPVTFILRPEELLLELVWIIGAVFAIKILPVNVLLPVPFTSKDPAKVAFPTLNV